MPIALVVLLVGFGAILLERSATRRGVALVDLTRYRLHHGDRWFSPDWRDELEDLLLRGGSLLATDLDARRKLFVNPSENFVHPRPDAGMLCRGDRSIACLEQVLRRTMGTGRGRH